MNSSYNHLQNDRENLNSVTQQDKVDARRWRLLCHYTDEVQRKPHLMCCKHMSFPTETGPNYFLL